MNRSLLVSRPVPSILPPAVAVVVCGFLCFPVLLLSLGAIVASLWLVFVIVRSTFAGLVLLLAIVPFITFLDFYLPATGFARFGALLRDILTLLTIIVCFYIRIRNERGNLPLLFIEKLAIWYFLLVLLFIPAAPSTASAVISFRDMSLYVLLMVVASQVVTTRKRLRILTSVLLSAALLSSFVGILESATNREVFNWIGFDLSSLFVGSEKLPNMYLWLPRASGGTGNPLEFGLLMAIITVLCAGFIIAKHAWRRPLIILVLVSCTVAVLLTLARSAYLSLLVGLATLAIVYRKKTVLVPLLLMFVLGAAINKTPYGAVLNDRLTLQDEAGITTAEERITIWQQVLNRMITAPFGYGLGTQGGGSLHGNVAQAINVTDNYFGNITMQVGIFPLLVLLTLFALLGRRFAGLFISLRDVECRAYAAVGIAVLLMILANFFVSSSFDAHIVNIPAWILFGTNMHLNRIELSKA